MKPSIIIRVYVTYAGVESQIHQCSVPVEENLDECLRVLCVQFGTWARYVVLFDKGV